MKSSDPIAAVERLTALASVALEDRNAKSSSSKDPGAEPHEQSEAERVLNLLDVYLTAFEEWQAEVTAANPLGPDSSLSESEKSQFTQKLIDLEAVHQLLLSRADDFRHQIQLELSDIRKRSQALRAYIDQYPARVTIAGKREG